MQNNESEEKELVNYVGEAFRLPINIGFVVVAAVTTLVTLFTALSADFITANVPLFIALVAGFMEMVYLAFMPRNERFIKMVNARHGREADNIDRQLRSFDLLQKLDQQSVRRYMAFYQNKQQISENLLNSPVDIDYSYVEKLNQLEAYFVELLHSTDRYENTSDSGLPKLEQDIAKIHKEIEQTNSDKVRLMYEKRLSLLQKRKAKAADMKENLEVARVQLDAVEDAIQILLHDTQNINNPERVLLAIDDVIGQAEVHSDTIQELDNLMNDMDFPEISESENEGSRSLN